MAATEEIDFNVKRTDLSGNEACFDNAVFTKEDETEYKQSAACSQGSGEQQDGRKLMAKDYTHVSAPVSPDTLSKRKKRPWHLLRYVVVCVVIIAIIGLTIGLIIHFMHDPDSSLQPTPSPSVFGLSRQLKGNLTIVDGPFSVFGKEYEDNTSPKFAFFLQSFRFKMDSTFLHSSFQDIYNSTNVLRISAGSVVVHFIILLREQRLLMVEDIQKMTSLIQDGFRDSIFVIRKESLFLHAEISDQVTTASPPRHCEVIRLEQCANFTSYQSTAVPNTLGHLSQDTAGLVLTEVTKTVSQACHSYINAFLCGVFAPGCGSDSQPIPPCLSFCQDVYEQCNSTLAPGASFPVNCTTLPDSNDPSVCMPHPYTPGKCVPVQNEICLGEGFNFTAFPNLPMNEGEEDGEITSMLNLISGLQAAVHCYKHSLLFGCSAFLSPCSGNETIGYHIIPPCKSLCEAYRQRCEVYLQLYSVTLPEELECDRLPDSPDPMVCVGYKEANEPPDFEECQAGSMRCDDQRCLSASWRCDGYQDCEDNLDESNCASCTADETLCSTRSTFCINTTDICDGDDHCFQSTDEAECVRTGEVNDSMVLEVRNAVLASWEEVCSSGWNQTFALLTCKQLGYSAVLNNSLEMASPNRSKAIIGTLTPGGHPDRLQSFLTKGHVKCPDGDTHVIKLSCWDPVCGIRPARYQSPMRVVGGDEVRPGTWPWIVSMHGGSDHTFSCAATIIHPEWLITAGHCVGGASQEPSQWTFIAGNTRRFAYSIHRQIRKPKQLIVHPGFDLSTLINDITLVQLDMPLELNDYVWPVCLSSTNREIEIATRCYTAGWGKTDYEVSDYEPALREVNVDIVSRESCKAAIKRAEDLNLMPLKLTDTMICAGGAAGYDACNGDSGGPLMCLKANTSDQWYQAGIVSWGINCATRNAPGIYTKLSLYVDWIEETIRNNTST